MSPRRLVLPIAVAVLGSFANVCAASTLDSCLLDKLSRSSTGPAVTAITRACLRSIQQQLPRSAVDRIDGTASFGSRDVPDESSYLALHLMNGTRYHLNTQSFKSPNPRMIGVAG